MSSLASRNGHAKVMRSADPRFGELNARRNPQTREQHSGSTNGRDRRAARKAKQKSNAADRKKNLRAHLEWILRRHKEHGGVTEIRLIQEHPVKNIWSGYWEPDHLDELVDLLLPEDREKVPYGQHPRIGEANVYVCLHPADPQLLARCAFEFRHCAGTGDKDVVATDVVLIDIDPVRASGISATKIEKLAARDVRHKVLEWLTKRGITALRGDSGNGYHLLIPTIPYKNTEAVTDRVEQFLHLLDKKFSTATVKIDTTVGNPARISKVYGTLAMKGSNTTDRPHRYAKVSFPDDLQDVDLFNVLKKELRAFRRKNRTHTSSGPKSAAKPGAGPRLGGQGSWDQKTSCEVLEKVLELSKQEHRIKKKEGSVIYEFEDCPYHTDPDGDHYECCAIVRPDGKFAGKCMHNDDAGWPEFKKVIGWKKHIRAAYAAAGIAWNGLPYEATPDGLVWIKSTDKGVTRVPLCNFSARIIADCCEHDGQETRHVLEIEAKIHGRTKRFSVPAAEFSAMKWEIDGIGPDANIYAGHGRREHVRSAIQALSGKIKTKKVFTHLGWTKVNKEYVYLHAGGAIGAGGRVDGVQVALPDPFDRFLLPKPPTGAALVEAVKASLKLLKLVPDRIGIPLFGCIWRAPIGDVDYCPCLIGETGIGKTEYAALLQQHWGLSLNARGLPASWISTANANESLCFTAKDTLLVIDDFSPTGSRTGLDKLHREAERLLRAVGNHSGRGRMRADTTLRPPKPPRALVVSTGEDSPRGRSLRARLFVL